MLVSLIVGLVVLGLVLYLINNFLPMDAEIKQLLNIVVVIAAILWILRAFGLLAGL